MAKFLAGAELTDKIYKIIWEAENTLLIVSPFIKLDPYFKELFEKHKHRHKLSITIVFGKNEGTPGKSLRPEDLDFFKQFRNISIIYCPNLHAKYYANNSAGVITSINLYDTSFNSNIEYGVSFEIPVISLSQTPDDKAFKHSMEVASKNPVVFIKRPVYEKTFLGAITGSKNYIDSEILYDKTDLLLNNWSKWLKEPKKLLDEFPDEKNANDRSKPMPVKEIQPVSNEKAQTTGYCIRTGVKIPFNPQKPMSSDAYQTWALFKNWDYPEKYCHKTGRPSNGATSMRNPIL